MPKDYPDKNAGTIRCVTAEQQAEMEQSYAERKEAAKQAEQEKREAARRKEEERKEAARRKVEEQKADARRKEEERKNAIRLAEEAKQQAELKRKQEQEVAARQKVSEQIKQALEKQRQADLQKAAQAKQQELQGAAPRQFNFTECQLIEMANGADSQRAKSNCNSKYLQTRTPAAVQPPALSPTPGAVTPEQLEQLKRKAVTLQPEQRKIAVPSPPLTVGPPRPLSTFTCGTPPNQYPCPAKIEPRAPNEQSLATEESSVPSPFLDGKTEKSPAEGKKRKTDERICVTTTETCPVFFGRRYAPPDAADGQIGPPTSWFNSKACNECQVRVHKTCQRRWGIYYCTSISGERSCKEIDRPTDYAPPESKTLCWPKFS